MFGMKKSDKKWKKLFEMKMFGMKKIIWRKEFSGKPASAVDIINFP